MAEDVGSAILAGIQGVQQMGAQRMRNRIAQDQLAQEERRLGILDRQVSVQEANQKIADTEATDKQIKRENGSFIDATAAAGYLTRDMMGIDTARMAEGIKKGDQVATQIALNIANKSGELPPGSVAESLQILPDGNYAITVRNKDGSKGAVTVDGSSNQDSTVMNFTPDRLAGISNIYYKTKVLSNNDRISPTIFRAYENQTDSDASRNEEFDRVGRINEALAATPDPGARRALVNAFGAASGNAQETDQILDRVEADYEAAGRPIGRRRANRNATLSTSGQPAAAAPAAPAPAAAAPAAAAPAVDPKLEGMYKRLAPELEGVTRNRAKNIVGAGDAGTNETVALLKDPKAFSNEEVAGVYDIAVRNGDENTATYLKDVMLNRGYADVDIRRRRAKVEADVQNEAAARSRDLAASNAQRSRDERLARIRGDVPVPGNQAPPAAGGITAVAAKVDGRPTTEVDRAIASGEIQVTPDTAAAVQRELQSKGITNIRQLARLNDRDRALTRAVILAVEKDPTIRAAKAQEISNIFDNPAGSVSLTRQEFDAQEISRTTNEINAFNAQTNRINAITSRDANRIRLGELTQRRSEFLRGLEKDGITRRDELAKEGSAFIDKTKATFVNPETNEFTLSADSSKKFLRTVAPNMMYRVSTLADKNPAEANALLLSMNPGLSLALAGLAAEEIGGPMETVLSFFRPDAGDVASMTDFSLARVRVQKDSKGNPQKFFYLSDDGLVADEGIPASVVQSADNSLYRILIKAADVNQNKQNFNPSTSARATAGAAYDRSALRP
jgi:hypothetical protein